ncbi:MAG: alpha-ketoglutarate-dependent dioxygenase AlkB [Actinomycetota bacterium]
MIEWQASLLDGTGETEPRADLTFTGLVRHQLDHRCWVDHVTGWLSGSDVVFETLVAEAKWAQLTRRMYDKQVEQPRLTAPWRNDRQLLVRLPVIDEMRSILSARYEVELDSGGVNFYRDGRDSVAWHADRIPKEIVDPVVCIVSVGEPRKFLLRPRGGGASLKFMLGRGDLLVTGGATQRAWDHSVPKVAHAGPRISITFRHGIRPVPE